MEECVASMSVKIPAPAYRMAKAQAAKCGANLSDWIGAAIVAYAAQTDEACRENCEALINALMAFEHMEHWIRWSEWEEHEKALRASKPEVQP